jgi:predicted nucleic acid-binding protein
VILDTSGLLVFLDRRASDQQRAQRLMDAANHPLLLSPFVLAEVDYLVSSRLGVRASRDFLSDVAHGAYQLAPMAAADVGAAGRILDRYQDLKIGLADASSVLIAERHGVADILTFDQRHFRAMTWGKGRPFRVLPADAA